MLTCMLRHGDTMDICFLPWQWREKINLLDWIDVSREITPFMCWASFAYCCWLVDDVNGVKLLAECRDVACWKEHPLFTPEARIFRRFLALMDGLGARGSQSWEVVDQKLELSVKGDVNSKRLLLWCFSLLFIQFPAQLCLQSMRLHREARG